MDSTEPYYESSKERIRKEMLRERHYYGDIVRSLFFAGAIVMTAALPFFSGQLAFPKEFALAAVLIFVVVAGMTDPVRKWSAVVNVLISLIALAGFEYNVLQTYTHYTQYPWFFWGNQALAINFFFASYYSIKTLRGMVLNQ